MMRKFIRQHDKKLLFPNIYYHDPAIKFIIYFFSANRDDLSVSTIWANDGTPIRLRSNHFFKYESNTFNKLMDFERVVF